MHGLPYMWHLSKLGTQKQKAGQWVPLAGEGSCWPGVLALRFCRINPSRDVKGDLMTLGNTVLSNVDQLRVDFKVTEEIDLLDQSSFHCVCVYPNMLCTLNIYDFYSMLKKHHSPLVYQTPGGIKKRKMSKFSGTILCHQKALESK